MKKKGFIVFLTISLLTFITYIILLICIFNILLSIKTHDNYNKIIALGITITILIIISFISSIISFKKIEVEPASKKENHDSARKKHINGKLVIVGIAYAVILLFTGFHFTVGAFIGIFTISEYESNLRIKDDYGTIQKLLENHIGSYRIDWNYSKKDDGTIRDKLYVLDFEEIKKDEYYKYKSNNYFEYGFPFDDYAGIYLTDSGYGYIEICPDLSPSYNYYFKTNKDEANELYQLVVEKINEG